MTPDRSALQTEIRNRGLSMTVDEAERLHAIFGRMPSPLEFHLFDIMWSEHCSYKSSRKLLKTLPTRASQVVIGPGEDAGVVRFCTHQGTAYDIVVAHESHNHPSQVLPVEGAATGVGGIVRDVYCMGADVIGSLDLLRFGDPLGRNGERCRGIARGVVEGIWQYGNALGVPNLGGDTEFHPGYDDNCLVNVVALGIVRHDRVVHSYVPLEARQEPYVFILTGKPTDDTGFGGATFASADLDGELGMKSVQVADPFLKRILAQANRDVLDYLFETGVAFGFKDLGAGGIACVTSEMAAHGGLGIHVNLDDVPVSIQGLPPEVAACSETQERFGFAVPARVADGVLAIYNEKYELPRLFPGARAAVIGHFTHDPVYRVTHCGTEAACAPAEAITEGVFYDRPHEPVKVSIPDPALLPCSPEKDIPEMLLSVGGCSRSAVWSYYDSEVRGATVLRPGEADSCVILPIPGCPAGLAVSGDGNPWYGELDPFQGGAHAVAEAVRNVVSVGAVPLCATDCLNYGSPESPSVMHQFHRGIEGIADACRHLGFVEPGEPLPIVSGNVSFYNQSSSGRSIPPSPIVAVFGRIDDCSKAVDMVLKRPGNVIVLLGPRHPEFGGSLYYRRVLGHSGGRVPLFRGPLEAEMARWVLGKVRSRELMGSHDISTGGLALSAAEMVLASTGLGIALLAGADPVLLYSETPGYLLEMDPSCEGSLPEYARVVGHVTSDGTLSGSGWSVDIQGVRERWADLLASIVWREEGV
jgi:phosphoribosylformylglycinamidine synthase